MDLLNRLGQKTFTLTDAATVTVSALNGHRFYLSTALARTIGAPGAGYDGQQIVIAIKNTAGTSQNQTLTTGVSNSFRFGSTITGLTTIVAGKTDYITAVYHNIDSRWDVVGYSKGF